MSETQIETSELRPIVGKLVMLRRQAEELTVLDQDGYRDACNIALAARAEVKNIERVLKPGIDSARAHLDGLRRHMESHIAQVKPIEELASSKAAAWKAEERRKADEEERRLNEEARIQAQRKADEERKELERLAAAEREAKEKEIAAARKAGEVSKREAERQTREAVQAEQREKDRLAEQAAERARSVEVVKVDPAVPKIAGIKARVNWRFRIVDEFQIPRAYLTPDQQKIGAEVRRLKKAGPVIPGIEAYSEDAI